MCPGFAAHAASGLSSSSSSSSCYISTTSTRAQCTTWSSLCHSCKRNGCSWTDGTADGAASCSLLVLWSFRNCRARATICSHACHSKGAYCKVSVTSSNGPHISVLCMVAVHCSLMSSTFYGMVRKVASQNVGPSTSAII